MFEGQRANNFFEFRRITSSTASLCDRFGNQGIGPGNEGLSLSIHGEGLYLLEFQLSITG